MSANAKQLLQSSIVFFGCSVLTNLVMHHSMPWWLALGIVLWTFLIASLAFIQGQDWRQ